MIPRLYYVFAGDQYYPTSGLGDYRGAFETQEDAERYVKNCRCDWWVILRAEVAGLVEIDSGYRDY